MRLIAVAAAPCRACSPAFFVAVAVGSGLNDAVAVGSGLNEGIDLGDELLKLRFLQPPAIVHEVPADFFDVAA